MVALRFPPDGGAGVQRTCAFARHLQGLGWDVHVLTGPEEKGYSLPDPTLLERVPEGVTVWRTGYFDSRALFRGLGQLHLASLTRVLTPSLPNMDAGWIPYGIRRGGQLLRRERFDVIVSSAYPMASHLVAAWLHRSTGVPWVADYRDEWSLRDYVSWPTPLHARLARSLDRIVVRGADRVVTTSPAHTRRFAGFVPDRPDRVVTITNGFDEELFAGPAPEPPERPAGFVVGHVGTVFSWRGVGGFLDAVEGMLASERLAAGDFHVRLVGHAPDVGRDRLRSAGILGSTGFVSHGRAVAWMRHSDLLLLVNTETTNIPTKTYEYLASGRPILALVRPGPTADLVRELEAGTVVDPEDRDGIERALEGYVQAWSEERMPRGADPADLEAFTRRATSRALDEVLRRVSPGDGEAR